MARILVSTSWLMATGAVVPVYAGAWTAAGRTQLSTSYDDNVLLTPETHIGGWYSAADLSAQLQFEADQVVFRADPRLLATRYQSETNLNRTERYLTLFGQFTSELAINSLTLSAAQDTTLTSELGLTGFAAVNKKHRTSAATFNTTHAFNEFVDGSLQLYATTNRYLDAQGTGLIDYNYGSALLNVNYKFTERSSFFLQTSAGKLQVPSQANTIAGLDYNKTNLAAVLGYSVMMSPRWKATVYWGPSQVRTGYAVASGSDYSVSVTRKSELMSLATSFTRDVTPSGYGLLSRRDQARLDWNQPLTERWATNWSLISVRTRNVLTDGSLELNSVNYRDLTGGVSWLYSPTWTVSLSAGYTRQQVQGLDVAANRHHAALNISWNGLARRLN